MARRRRRRDVSRPPAGGSILLASEGRPITAAAVERAAALAGPAGAVVHVLSTARIWGTSLGLPMPGLLPSKREWDDQRTIVADAVRALERRGVTAKGHVVGTRRAAREIVERAARLRCEGIVMAADPPRSRLVADLMWSQEPQRVRRRTKVPVYLVGEDGSLQE